MARTPEPKSWTPATETDEDVVYRPAGPVVERFHKSDAFFRGLRGPIGSGKTSGAMTEIWRRACQIPRAKKDGVRRSRWVIVRATYPELQMTLVPLWLEWFPQDTYGKFFYSIPYHQTLTDPVGGVEAECWFVSMDRPKDARKVLSFNLTGAYINEAREIDKENVDAITSRCGRYPGWRTLAENYDEEGHASRKVEAWGGCIADTNSPNEGHWWPIMEGVSEPPESMSLVDRSTLVKPDGWEFFTQPQAMFETSEGELKLNPDAENLQNLNTGYYNKLIAGKRRAWIRVMVLNQIGSASEAAVMQTGFVRDFHVAKGKIKYNPALPLVAGMDGGLTPAAVIAQYYKHLNRIVILREIVTSGKGMAARQFGRHVTKVLAQHYPGAELKIAYHDPSDRRDGSNGEEGLVMLRAEGINAIKAPGNNIIETRIAGVDLVLERQVDGEPMLLIDPSCMTLTAGLESEYKRERIPISTELIYAETALKNRWSHVCEALQYLILGVLGVGFVNQAGSSNPVVTLSTRLTRRNERSMRKRIAGRRRKPSHLSAHR